MQHDYNKIGHNFLNKIENLNPEFKLYLEMY